MRNFLSSFTLLLLVITFGNVSKAKDLSGSPESAGNEVLTDSSANRVDVYYFYFQPRCQTCIDIEQFSKEAVESGFPEELQSGTIHWHAFDVDVKEFEHYWYDFELETKSVIVEVTANGKQLRWKNCDKVWDLVLDKPAFIKYIQDEVRKYQIN